MQIKLADVDKHPFLDDVETIDVDGQHGYVRLINVSGGDDRVVAAARNTTQTKGSQVEDRNLVRFLMRHHHDTPFEFVQFTFEVKMPIFVARQLVRQRTQGINEMSARYSELPEEYFVPPIADIAPQSKSNRQGRTDDVLADADEWCEQMYDDSLTDFKHYHDRLEAGMARETARMTLPLNTYTVWWTTMNLRNALWMLNLRLDPHAQKETRRFAQAMAAFIKTTCPVIYHAFEDYVLNAITLTVFEQHALARHMQRLTMDKAEFQAIGATGREWDEWQTKLGIILGS